MFVVKVLFMLTLTSIAKQQEVTEVHLQSTNPEESSNEDEFVPGPNTDVPPANNRPQFEVPRPPFGFNDQSPNFFHNLFTQFFRPLKNTGKTYGPNIIAIIGDKPYISMEIFNKFSPFRWLISAFQGKIQNLCGFLAPPGQADTSFPNPQNILEQLIEESQKPLSDPSQTILGSRPISIYDVPSTYRHTKKKP